jgi:hypothetical protein
MGIVPVAPKRSKLLSEGDKKVSGFRVSPAALGFSRMEMMYMTTLREMINLMS